jgi:hypothetical protein
MTGHDVPATIRRVMAAREKIIIRVALACALGLLVVFAVLLATQHRATATAPDFRVVRVGGVEYESMQGRPMDLRNPEDRRIVAGLPARQRHAGRGRILLGAFVATTNDSSGPRRTAGRIELRDQGGHVYRPLALPPSNPYAYTPRLLKPGERLPAFGSPADVNLAATGELLLFRVPARRYESGDVLELVIHDPSHPTATASLIV